MKKIFFPFLLVLALVSCSDGDLQIETIDFNDEIIQFCDAPQADSGNLLFKINNSEALILTLQSGVLNNGSIGETVITESSISSQSQLIYRNFSDGVSSSYFCSDVPPATPTVSQEVVAEDGLVTIVTTANADQTEFEHNITLSGVSFITENGERITNLTIDEFGMVSTAITN